jgi:porin
MNLSRLIPTFLCLFACVSTATDLSPYITLISDSSKLVSGGSNSSPVNRALLDMGIELALSTRSSVALSAQLQRGKNGSDYVGDIQAFSNIDEDDFSRVYEAWYQYEAEQFRFKLGQVDLNSEFAFTNNGGEFINSSMGFSPSIFVLPTYPQPVYAATVFYRFNDDLQLASGVSAGEGRDDFSSQFYISQLNIQLGGGMLGLGAWRHTGTFVRLDNATTVSGTQGVYLTYDKTLEINTPLSEQMGLYIQAGDADKNLAKIHRHLGAGLLFESLLGHQEYSLGIGFTKVWLADIVTSGNDSESSLEVFYKWQINEHVSIKPDLQFITTPGGNKQLDDTLVATLRLEFAL